MLAGATIPSGATPSRGKSSEEYLPDHDAGFANFLQIRRYLLTHRSKSTQLPKGQVKAPAP
jgi:hypothetical protein